MKLIGRPQGLDPYKPRIDDFHRVALGLESGTRVYLRALRPTATDRLRQVLLTTFNPKDWENLYRVTRPLDDTVGAVANFAEGVSNEVNIGILETLTTETGTHDILGILQATEPPSMGGSAEQLRRLHDASSLPGKNFEGEIDRGCIVCRSEDFRQLYRELGYDTKPPARVLMFSDTEEKYLSLQFPHDDAVLMHLSIEHEEQPGAIREFSAAVGNHDTDILSSYSRLQRSRHYAQWKVTLDVPATTDCGTILESLSSRKRFFHGFDALEISYVPREGARQAQNPFRHTAGISGPEMFKGRTELLRRIVGNPETPRVRDNFILSGYSRTGKTCVLDRLQEILGPHEGVATIDVNVAGSSRREFWITLLRRAYEQIHSGDETRLDKVRGYFRTRRPFEGIDFGIKFDVLSLQWKGRQDERATEIEESLRKALRIAESKSIKRFVFLLDEAQDFLRDSGANRLFQSIWLRIMGRFRSQIHWVVASAAEWRESSQLRSGLLPKLRWMELGPLTEEAAVELVSDPFGEIRVHSAAVKRIRDLAGDQPCYIQVLCGAVFDEMGRAPPQVNVVCRDDVDRAIDPALQALDTHFAQMYDDLQKVLDHQALHHILLRRNECIQEWRMFDSKLSTAESVSCRLAAVPGLVLSRDTMPTSRAPRSYARERNMVTTVKLFRKWARQSAVRRHLHEPDADWRA